MSGSLGVRISEIRVALLELLEEGTIEQIDGKYRLTAASRVEAHK